MKKIFIEGFMDYVGKEIEEYFFVRDILPNHNRQGTSWMNVMISDRTGDVKAKIWPEFPFENTETCESEICLVKGKVDIYNGQPGCAITGLRQAEPEEYDTADFIKPLEENARRELLSQFDSLIRQVKDQGYRSLLSAVFVERNIKKLCELPAGVAYHHSMSGGLLLHTIEVARLAISMAGVHDSYAGSKHYAKSRVDMDLLITGALLHDIGKITEYRPFPFVKRTERGRLVGHLSEGAIIIACYNNMLGKDVRLRDTSRLINLVVSSHGDGGGMKPSTLEGIILTQADRASSLMDAYDCAFKEAERKHPGYRGDSAWCGMLNAKVYRPVSKEV